MKLLRLTTVPLSLAVLIKGQMRFMRSRGFEVVSASSPGGEVEKVKAYEGVPHYAFPLTRTITPWTDLKALAQLTRFMRKEKFTLVHTHTPKAGLLGMLAARIAGIPVRMHTVAGIPWMESTGNKRKLLRSIEKLTYACAHRVYPNSEGLADFIRKEKLCATEKLQVIGSGSSNGIDTSYFHPDQVSETKEQLRQLWGIPPEAFVFVFVGRLVGDKGIHELAVAFRELLERVPRARLILVGPFEDERDPVKAETKTYLEQTPEILLTDFQSDVRPFLKMADVLAFPSYREGFPNVPMQAGAMQLPCIVTDINGCNEIVQERVNGLLIPPKDENALRQAMYTLVEDRDLYRNLQEQARKQIVERYEQAHVWELLHQEYLRIMQAKGIPMDNLKPANDVS